MKAKRIQQIKEISVIVAIMATAALVGGAAKVNETPHIISPLPLNAYAMTETTPTPTPTPPSFKDERAQKLYNFLSSVNSPLANYADYFVAMADKYDLPYTLSAAISCKESSCGKHLANSFNAWGITSGNPSGPRFRAFSSWEESIEAHARLLSKEYRFDMTKGIQRRYCPAVECSSTWSEDVTNFSKEMNQ